MNPGLVRELDREGAAILQRVRAIPAGDRRDMSAHIDAKSEICRDLDRLFKRWREAGAGTAAERPSDLFGGTVKSSRPRVRRVEGVGGR